MSNIKSFEKKQQNKILRERLCDNLIVSKKIRLKPEAQNET